jgi:ACS family pantothenate transporter-like MFS transporter
MVRRNYLPLAAGCYTDCCLFVVTPGNRAAAVVGGLNVIVFIIIAVLDHREKIQKKRDGELNSASVSPESSAPSIGDVIERKGSLGVEEIAI